MQSPLIIHQKLLGQYQDYLAKQFKSKNPTIDTGRNALYRSKGVTFQPPFLEFLFNYQKSGVDFRNPQSASALLPYFNGESLLLEKFCKLIGNGLAPYEVYKHQWNMLCETILNSKHSIITTGTGSGKTESFMLPLIAYLSKQLLNEGQTTYSTGDKFRRLDNGIYKRRTSEKIEKFNFLREDGNRRAAVKAIMLFPMNALVEDQLKRIRNAFSNPDVLDIMDSQFGGNRIFYGKYNGLTPGTGSYNKNQLEKYYDALAKNEKEIIDFANSKDLTDNKRYDEALNYFGREITEDGQRLTGEMLNRYDMQNHPPDILITNFSMLNVMLTRSVEQPIWEKTAEWLKQDDAVFHVVLDELHLYRGSAGTEIAYSISALLERLGIAGQPSKVRFLASSASLDMEHNSELVKKFIGGFFNIPSNEVPDRFHLETGETVSPAASSSISIDKVKNTLIQLHEGATDIDSETLEGISKSTFVKELCEWYTSSTGGGNRPCSLEQFAEWLLQKFEIVSDSEKEIQNIISARPDTAKPSYSIVNGFFLFRDSLDKLKISHSVPRIRMHLFYNNFEGLWGSIQAEENNEALFGNVYNYPKKIDEDGNKAYQLFYCEKCETSFIGGYREQGKAWTLESNGLPGAAGNQYYTRRITPTEVSLGSDSHRAVSADTNQLSYKDFSIFWPENQQPDNSYIKHIPKINPRDRISEKIFDEDMGHIVTSSHGFWIRAFFNPNTGEVRMPANINSCCPEGFIRGRHYVAFDNKYDVDIYYQRGVLHNKISEALLKGDESTSAKALSQCCPSCATKKTLTPIVRGYRTGFNKTNQLFASGLFRSLKQYNPINTPKIVSFSDSRDEAAKVSAGVESQHFNETISNYLLSELTRQSFAEEEKEVVLVEQASNAIAEIVRTNIDFIRQTFDKAIDGGDLNIIMGIFPTLNLQQTKQLDLLALYGAYSNAIAIEPIYTVNKLVGDFRHGYPITGLHRYLLEMGVDVRGVYNVKPFLKDEQDNQLKPSQKWFEPLQLNNGVSFTGADNNIHTYYSNSQKFLKAYLLRLMFVNSIFDIESMGLGKLVPCFDEPLAFPKGQWDSFIYGLVKLMGRTNKYTPRLLNVQKRKFENGQINPVQNLPEDIANYLDTYNKRKGTSIEKSLVLSLFHNDLVILDFSNDKNPVAISALKDDEKMFQCYQCEQVYSQEISHCLNCGSTLGFNKVLAVEIRNRSYTGSHIQKLNEVHRLHCEELSGQTDEPFERQRHFLGLIKDDHLLKKAQEIDLLAVTTTLEVGVDIGSLQGMLMANMPPQRFNYQQRVGRVGRRGQAFSFAVTLCRSKSHDAHYFQHPDEITGDPSPTPFLNVEQPEILERVINKYFLSAFFREFAEYLNVKTGITNWHELFAAGDINGEFGRIRHGLPHPYLIDEQSNNNPESYLEFLPGFVSDNVDDLEKKYNGILTYIRRNESAFKMSFADYLSQLIATITSNELLKGRSPEESLAAALMEQGHLPSYGMPTKIAYLYNDYSLESGWDFTDSKNSPKSMDRTIDVAIFDYAPGTTKLKDKIEYTVKAIVPDVVKKYDSQGAYWRSEGDYFRSQMLVYQCDNNNCKHFKLAPVEQNNDTENSCDSCGVGTLNSGGIIAVEPKNFSVIPRDRKEREQSNISSNNRLAVSGLQPILWDHRNSELGNIKRTYSESDSVNFIYKINKGRSNEILMGNWDVIYNQVKGLSIDAPQRNAYWFYTRKNTDTLSFIVHTFLNQRFNLCIENNIQANLEKKAIFLSAATILQRCFADILDIDPREIEFANPDFTNVSINGQPYKTLQLTFYDSHDNGSGYIRKIQEMLDSHTALLNFIQESKFYRNALTTAEHKASCLSGSCYKCIRTYDNSSLHGLLDWRLGLDLINFMSDAEYEIDFIEFERYVMNIAGPSRFTARIIIDEEDNKAIEVIDLANNPRYLVTHPIARFDSSTYQTNNPSVEVKSIYSLILTL